MNRSLRFLRIVALTAIVAGLSVFSAGAGPTHTPARRTEVEVLRFDAILELNAPLAGTHSMLCARYWVSPKHYDVAVVWGEPGERAVNFSTYPPTLTVQSSEQGFSLNSQIRTRINTTFPKPLGERGVFRNKFNNYPLENVRFAETEALSARIYTQDLEKIRSQGEDAWQTDDVGRHPGQSQSDRDVGKLAARMADGRIVALKLIDPNGHLIKSTDYDYARHEGRSILARENVLLPERMLTVGYNKGGAKVKIGAKEQTFKELPGTHHKGGRRCTIEYQGIKMGDGVVAVPNCITVRHGQTNAVLRTARISNLVQLKKTPEETEEAALQFAQFNDNELKVRELSSKYWQKDPDKIEDEDGALTEQLRAHFENLDVTTKTLGEQLKRINMLMQLDWIQAHDALSEHFQEYLHILASNDLNQIVLIGGLEVVGATIEWGQFHIADELLKDWIESARRASNVEDILSFAHIQMRTRHYWPIAKLLEECSKCSQDWKGKLFDAQALRSIALWELSEMVKDPSKAKGNRSIAQAGFASWSLGADGLSRVANESLAESKRLFAGLDAPTPKQKALKRQLDQIDPKLAETGDSGPDGNVGRQ